MLSSACRRGFLSCARKAANPLAFLFAAGQQGLFYDPSDLSTLFQDSTGATPVTAVGQSVGKILDKSGRGNHAIQATSGNRPTLQQDANGMYYLAFNGTTSSLATAASVDFSAVAQMSVFAGVYGTDLTTLAIGTVVNHNGPGFTSFGIWVPDLNSGEIAYFSGSNTLGNTSASASGQSSPFIGVLTGQTDLSAGTLSLRKNGTLARSATPAYGGGTFANATLSVGVQSTSAIRFFNGRIYSLIVRGAASSASEVAAAEALVNGKTRAY